MSYDSDDENFRGRLSAIKEHLPGKLGFARIGFVSFTFIGFVLALMFRDGFWGLYYKIPYFDYGCQEMEKVLHNACIGTYMIHRVSFSLVIFYLFHAFLSSRIFFVGDQIRLALQYHWITWLLRFPLLLFLFVVAFFIPNPFFYVYGWVAIFMSGLFLLVQVILLIDFGYEWAETWRNKSEETWSKWNVLMLIFSVIFYLISIAIVVLQFVFFGSGGHCHLNRIFICSIVIIGLVISVLSMFTKRGILPPSIITVYIAFVCWSALLSDPDQSCNLLSSLTHTSNTASQIITLIIGVLFAAFSLLRTAVSTGMYFGKLFQCCCAGNGEEDEEGDEAERTGLVPSEDEGEEERAQRMRAECNELMYSHIVFVFVSFYMSMVLSNWNVQSPDTRTAYLTVEVSVTSVWVKMSTAWITGGIYLWTLFAPYVLGRWRNFD